MIAVFVTMSNEVFVAELHRPALAPGHLRGAPATWRVGESIAGERGDRYVRQFKRTSFPDTPREGAVLPSQPVARYDEDPDQSMPPEILSRRMQEVEAEWLRLGALLERLRVLEAK